MSANFDLEEIRVFKLTNGDTIIGFQSHNDEFLDENPALAECICVQNPFKIKEIADPDDLLAADVELTPWMTFLEDQASLIQKAHIIATGIPDRNMINIYMEIIEAALNEVDSISLGPVS